MKIRIGGVPEHFNYPWHYGIDHQLFAKNEIEIEWSDEKGGSGAMCKKLEDNSLDLALVLTEGIVAHIHQGGTARIIQQYVKSPLIWGIHASKSFVKSGKPLSKAKFARSRVGSGSHIMAYVLAEQNNFEITESNFETVGNIDGALEAFETGTADVLLWEKFMTQPYVDAGKVDRVGECVSPWPCFVLVASQKFLDVNSNLILALSDAIIMASETAMKRKSTVLEIAKMYNLQIKQVEQWYSSVEWQTSDWISTKMLENVTSTLHRVGVISQQLTTKEMCYLGAKLY
jgi:sulfonate transport system substrate-binding protein